MKKIYSVAIFLMLLQVSFAQLTVNFSNSVASTTSSSIDIDVSVSDWDELIGAQFSINWDPNVFTFTSISNVSTELSQFTEAGNIGTPTSATVVEDGQLTVSWSQTTTLPASVPDGTRLFTLTLNAVGSNCQSTSLFLTDIPRVREVIDTDKDDIGVISTGGDISIDDGTCSGNGNMDGVCLISAASSGANGSIVCIPVTTSNFSNIASIQSGVTWNSSVLSFKEIKEGAITGITTNEAEVSSGVLRLLWIIAFGSDPVTLDDGATLFELCYDVVGNTGQSTNVSFADLTNYAVEIANGDGAAEDVCIQNGRFQATGGGGSGNRDGVCLDVSTLATNGAGDICVPVTTENFDNIASIQSGISWDASVLTFTGIEDGGLSGITVNSSNASDGELRLLWIIGLGADPVTLSDGATLFDICFTVAGSNGESSPVAFTSLPSFSIEIANGDGVSEEVCTTDGTISIGSGNGGGGNGGGNQEGVGLIAADVPCTATNVCVPITSKDFTSIASLQTGIEWDESIITYTGINDRALSGITVNSSNANNGELRLLWIIGLGQDPVTVADGEVLFDICFDTDGREAVVGFKDLTNFAIEIANGAGMSEEFFTDDGLVCASVASGDACVDYQGSGLALFTQSATVEQGSNVCVNVDTKNFNNLQSMQFTLKWDATNFNYTGQQDFGLTDLGNANFNFISPDKLRVSWTPISAASVDDCTTLFAVCFDAIGNCADSPSSVIEIIDDGNVLIEITNSNNDVVDVDIVTGTLSIAECMGNEPPVIVVDGTQGTCPGSSAGSIDVSVSGGTGALTCAWTDSTGMAVADTDCDLSGLTPGDYTLVVTDEMNNSSSATVTVVTLDAAMCSIDIVLSATPINCAGETGMISAQINGGCEVSSITIDGNMQELPFTAGSGTYTVVITDVCGNMDTETIELVEPSIIEVISSVTECSDQDGANGMINLDLSGGTGAYTITSLDGTVDGLSISDLAAGTYAVTAEDANGCEVLIENLEVEDCPIGEFDCLASSILSPNGDGKNDAFIFECQMRSLIPESNKLAVFDRWGNLVFQQENYDNSWSGLDMSGVELVEGGYMWVLKVSRPDDNARVFRGTVTLLRS